MRGFCLHKTTLCLMAALLLSACATELQAEKSPPPDVEFRVPIASNQAVPPLNPADEPQVAPLVNSLFAGEAPAGPIPAMLQEPNVAVYIALRWKGVEVGSAWASGKTGLASLDAAMQRAKARREGDEPVDIVEVVFAHDFLPVAYKDRGKYFSNIRRGLQGMEIQYDGVAYRYGPTAMIADNRSFSDQIERFAKWKKIAEKDRAKSLRLRRFEAEQFLVRLGPQAATVRMFRGNRLVPQSEVTQGSIEDLAKRMSVWLASNVSEDGRMTYKYWPSHAKESKRNNMIRQWMATTALGRIARLSSNPQVVQIADRNLRYNLANFYREENGLGIIEFDDKIKLGALAMAALAIVEHPNRANFAGQEKALLRTIDSLRKKSGSFHTFMKPKDRNDNHNYYPGEALYLWSILYGQSGDEGYLERILKSYEFYRKWHLKNRNPAFVPWHTMAYYRVWYKTKAEFLRDWIFQMNDWLVGFQAPPKEDYPDADGRFFDPKRPKFGWPHASSTGIYLEGLVDAFRLARAVGDTGREKVYRRAILRGLRSVMQLEFADEVDMYYIAHRDRVRGGIRTSVYDNEIRVDNVQHNLMAVRKVLATFKPEDYAL